jgi:hypothetical protein
MKRYFLVTIDYSKDSRLASTTTSAEHLRIHLVGTGQKYNECVEVSEVTGLSLDIPQCAGEYGV